MSGEARGSVEARLLFAATDEDARHESDLVVRTGAQAALIVASGGCTALTLASLHPGLSVTAFDVNERQLEHVAAKRDATLRRDLGALNYEDPRADGLNQCGERERLESRLRRLLHERVMSPEERDAFFAPGSPTHERATIAARWMGSPGWRSAFREAFEPGHLASLPLMSQIGRVNPGWYTAYHEFARCGFELRLRDPAPSSNAFAALRMLGHYTRHAVPDYFSLDQAPTLELVHGSLEAVPALERFRVVSLSNVLDWLEDPAIASWATRLAHALEPGSVVLIRSGSPKRDLQRFFLPHFRFDTALGREFVARDRNRTCPRIEVAVRRAAVW
jgi:S-adenosylmethionine-diacylglycerol 3-amino-3-carboxypropyl transferase